MPVSLANANRLAAIPKVCVQQNAPLSGHTRFEIGGPARIFCDTEDVNAFIDVLKALRELALPHVIIGGGTNLVVSDAGFDGVVLRYTGSRISRDGALLRIAAGAVLQDVVDFSIAHGLKGLETMTGIPGYLGGAIYGNAGAYGHSIQELIAGVRIVGADGESTLCNEQCRFRYRDSIFKDRKDWVILSADLRFGEADPNELTKIATGIRAIRDVKYPPTMRCAGSIFKNLLFADLPSNVQMEIPESLVREGKVPSAWFLEQIGAKGIRRGDIQVASYHANLIYNDGAGKAADLVSIIEELKQRVAERFGFQLEEEVQYVGFEYATVPA
ncbi:MAG: UDP-N-acetylmuramate dehydrogenase [Acidobacteriaceae bacterium]|nr:UDP-N-acetylmuramate dehydrogenase [Acidobacteriaceae bacterium]MBV9294879.1 UDP-N-acetylmuramate dehydrogenase [Acidobacteriaceae bacterium]MBV9767737.1 UDP-N-acetylmuramate dehydrogenase [Acidobacteriaceae bacterium]